MGGGKLRSTATVRGCRYKDISLFANASNDFHCPIGPHIQAKNAAIAALPVTRIVVAHRPETIRSVQRVVDLQDGQIAFDGPPQDYLRSLGQHTAPLT